MITECHFSIVNVLFVYFRIQTHAEVFALMLKEKLPKLAAHFVSCIILLSYPVNNIYTLLTSDIKLLLLFCL